MFFQWTNEVLANKAPDCSIHLDRVNLRDMRLVTAVVVDIGHSI